ncbi:MAG: hypothetical protein ACRELE_10480 [Gemmatimonadales bacterium]
MIVKRVHPTSAAKICGVIYAAIGFCVGVLMALVSMVGVGGMFGSSFGIGAIIVMPIIYGVVGFIATFIGALVYNAAAGRVGGVELDVE